MVERAIQMAESCIEEIQCRPLTNPPFDIDDVMQDLHVDSFLSHIHFFRVHSAAEQIAVVNRMERFLFDHKLVSLAFSMWINQDLKTTTKQITKILDRSGLPGALVISTKVFLFLSFVF